MGKKYIFADELADKLAKLPADAVGGIMKHLIRYARGEAESDSRWRKFEKMLTVEEVGGDVYTEIVDILNEELGTHYKATTKNIRKLIHARLEEGFTVDDFRKVIIAKKREWSGTEMARYLRPDTLFSGKFDAYLNMDAALSLKEESDADSSFDTDSFFEAAQARAYEDMKTDGECPFV